MDPREIYDDMEEGNTSSSERKQEVEESNIEYAIYLEELKIEEWEKEQFDPDNIEYLYHEYCLHLLKKKKVRPSLEIFRFAIRTNGIKHIRAIRRLLGLSLN